MNTVSLATLALAAAAACAAPSLALAASSASATLSFSAVATGGFAWTDPASSFAFSGASAADQAGWETAAGITTPVYGPVSSPSATVAGLHLQASDAVTDPATASGATALTRGAGGSAVLLASAVVPVAGRASADAFARSWFSLAPGASVTFRGLATLAVDGLNPALPTGWQVADAYGFARAELALEDGTTAFRELLTPGVDYVAGAYFDSAAGALTLTLTNPGATPLLSYVDSGVSVATVSAVPEPGALAMLLAGLGVVGAVARRRAPATATATATASA